MNIIKIMTPKALTVFCIQGTRCVRDWSCCGSMDTPPSRC